MKRIILGLLLLLSVPAILNSATIANFAVERYADYTWSKPSITTPRVPTEYDWVDKYLYTDAMIEDCLSGVEKDKDKACSGAGLNRIYSADAGVIVRDSLVVLLGVAGICLMYSAMRKIQRERPCPR